MDDISRPTPNLPEFVRDTATPPEVKAVLRNTEQSTPCGMPYVVVWSGGPMKDLPISAYCAEPLCLRPGYAEPGPCTGPRFVPHVQQYTTADPSDPRRKQRIPMPDELIEASRVCADKATRITKVRDHRTRDQIAKHIALTWQRTRIAFGGGGEWGL